MRCPECNRNFDCAIGIEKIICPHCNDIIYNNLNLCDECGLLWKSINDVVVENTVFRLPETDSLLPREDLISAIFDSTLRPNSNITNESKKLMVDYIHRCTICEGICYYTGSNVYKCIDCGFELEIVNE